MTTRQEPLDENRNVARPNPLSAPGGSSPETQFVLGTMSFGAEMDETTAIEVVRTAFELGVRMFDCANSYGHGRAEEILGRAIAPFRDQVHIATKVGSRSGAGDETMHRLGFANVIAACDASLRRLSTDHVDLYYLHMPDWNTPIRETLEACMELVEQGKVGRIGLSNYAAWQLFQAVQLSVDLGLPRIEHSQPMYNLLARRIEEEYVACTSELAVANLVYNPLAGGLLTGKYRRTRSPSSGGRFNRANYRERYWNDTQLEAVDRFQSIADAAGLTLIQLSLRWLLQRPWVSSIILGVSSVAHLETNVAAATGSPLDDAVMMQIDQVWQTLRGVSPAYNR